MRQQGSHQRRGHGHDSDGQVIEERRSEVHGLEHSLHEHSPESSLQSLGAADQALCDAAASLLSRTHDQAKHRVAAAVRTASGAIYLGVHVGSNRVNVCAEPSAIANACIAAEDSIETIVSVGMGEDGVPQVINPCGLCRELVPNYGAHIRVLVNDGAAVRAVFSSELLPLPWVRARAYG